MKVQELKNKDGYEFECNISEEYKNMVTDEWGCAYMWLDGKIGVEYNFCIQDDGTNCSAIYKMEYNKYTDYNGEITEESWETDVFSRFVHYEIDFNDTEWEQSLENAMCMALIKLFDL